MADDSDAGISEDTRIAQDVWKYFLGQIGSKQQSNLSEEDTSQYQQQLAELGGDRGRGFNPQGETLPNEQVPKKGKKPAHIAVYPNIPDPSAQGLQLDEGDIGGKKYKFSAEDLGPNTTATEDLTTSEADAPSQAELHATLDANNKGYQDIDPEKLTDREYDTLTKEASKGNKLAQQILVKGHYKENQYPTLSQDVATLTDPFVNALSGMPALAENLQAQQDFQTVPYDFTNAEAQVNNILGTMGSSVQATPSAATTNYANMLQGYVNQGQNQLTTPGPGTGSIMGALEGLGPAAKLSQQATPTQALLAALLSHLQYETIYGTTPTQTAKGEPTWMQDLLNLVSGSGSLASLGSLTAGTNAVGSTPSQGSTSVGGGNT